MGSSVGGGAGSRAKAPDAHAPTRLKAIATSARRAVRIQPSFRRAGFGDHGPSLAGRKGSASRRSGKRENGRSGRI